MPTGTGVPTPQEYLNPLGSYYDTVNVTNLIRDAIFRAIYDQAPKQYDPLRILNMAPVVGVPLDEFYYKEKVYSREALTVKSWVNGTATITLKGTYARELDMPVKKNTVIVDAGFGCPFDQFAVRTWMDVILVRFEAYHPSDDFSALVYRQ